MFQGVPLEPFRQRLFNANFRSKKHRQQTQQLMKDWKAVHQLARYHCCLSALILLAVLYGSFMATLRHGRIRYAAFQHNESIACLFAGCLDFSISTGSASADSVEGANGSNTLRPRVPITIFA